MNQFFEKSNLKNIFKKYKLAFISSFCVGVLISAIPYIYQYIDNWRTEKLIQEEKEIQIKEKEKKCKDNNSDYSKFLNLGFPDTALAKFNLCMKE